MFRIDRFLTLYFFSPLLKLLPPTTEKKIPILMYHSISERQKQGQHPYYETATSPGVFRDHLSYLRDNGYSVLGLNEIDQIFNVSSSGLEKYVVITFDDGFLDFYESAYPILEEYGNTATVFLPADMIGKQVNGLFCMSWNQIRELAIKGVSFGSHSMTHPKLVDLTPHQLENEIGDSKCIIEKELGHGITSFSYPYAFPEQNKTFCKNLEGLLRKYGYESGVTTIIGKSSSADNRLFLKRLPVNDYDDNTLFKAKLDGAYCWLHAGQRLVKRTKSLTGAI